MANVLGAVYEFGTFRLDAAKRLLTRDSVAVTIPPKTFDLLLLLVENRGRVLAKKELMEALWPQTFVEDANLSFQVSALRKALGNEGAEWVETLPRYGYRFSGKILEIPPHPAPLQATADTAAWRSLETVAVAEPDAPPRLRVPLYYWAVTGILGLATLFLLAARLWEIRPQERAVSFQISPPDLVAIQDVDTMAMSPTGDRILFVGEGPDGGTQLWLRPLDSLAASPVTGTELVDAAFWSPDGRSIAFFVAGKLKKMDLQSGTTQVICDVPRSRTSAGSWNRDGVILFRTNERPEIFRVAATGGQPQAVTRLNLANHEIRHSGPQFLPDGRHFLYFVQSEQPENSGIFVGSLNEPVGRRLTNASANAEYTNVGGNHYLLFARDTNLMGQAFDASRAELRGTAFVVAPRLLVGQGGGHPRAALSVSQNGVLAYRTRVDTGSTDLAWIDRSGKHIGAVGESGEFSNPALSPDGRKLILSRMDPQIRTRDLWLYDFASGAFSRFTFNSADETNPVWSPDGRRITFIAFHDGVIDLYEKEIAGGSAPKLLLHTGEHKYIHDWTPDGKQLLFRMGMGSWALPAAGGKLQGPYPMDNMRVSPNGKWVAYTSKQSGRSEVYVQRFPPSGGEWQISTTGGVEPSWREDGKELYFTNGDTFYAVPVRTDGPKFEPGAVKPLFTAQLEKTERRSRYQETGNGQRFLVNIPRESSSPITISTSWLPRPAR